MDDLISRQATIDVLEWTWAGKAAIDAVKALPSAQNRGTWIWDDEGYHCSECWYHADTGDVMSGEYKFCPLCGTRMEGETDG